MEKIRTELKPKFDTKASFYNKAELEQIETKKGNKIYILYSYKTPVLGIIKTNYNMTYLYLNEKIKDDLLLSQTTLRHIKETLKQIFENRDYTKKDILKICMKQPFEYLHILETNDDETADIVTEEFYQRATSPETKKFFNDALRTIYMNKSLLSPINEKMERSYK